ncbi:hypothetical protein TNCV_14411 [Trichonephila clavipes]|nr:hypothetical protein TNCV_14411 [Trichonephila clavipes]
MDRWATVLFTDEFRFSLNSDSHRTFIWREPRTRYLLPTENSPAVLNHKILEANSQVQNVKLGGHQMCLSINRLWHELFTPNAAVLFVDVAIQPEVRFIAKQNSLMKIGNNGNGFGPIRRIYALLDDRFDESPNQTENKSLDSCQIGRHLGK